MSPRILRGLALVVGCLAWGSACGGNPVAAARARALAYFETTVDEPSPTFAHLFPYLERRFGLEALGSTGEPLHALAARGRPEGDGGVYDRLVDPDATLDAARIAELPTAVDRVTALALHCDRVGLPEDWVDALGRATAAGGYALTHAVLAVQWTLENGCLAEAALAGLHAAQIQALVTLLGDRVALAERFPSAADLWIEALVMLYYAGEGERVRPEWIEVLLDLQREDGGFPAHPGHTRGDPHATALALWALSENLPPVPPPVRWIPR